MSDISKHLFPALLISSYLMSTMPVLSKSVKCSNRIWCNIYDCPTLDASCTCLQAESSPTISVMCSKWSPQWFSFASRWDRKQYTITTLNGLNRTIPSEFLEWFVPKLRKLTSKNKYDISNFCNDPLKTSNHISLSKIFDTTPPLLTSLKMSHNCLQSITGDLQNHHYFLQLDLSFNKLTQLPRYLYGIDRITMYDLSYNNISTVSRTDFNCTRKLEQLNLSHNNLSSLPRDFLRELEDLEVLDLSHNHISFIPVSLLRKNLFLIKFDISNNRVTSIPDNLFYKLRSLVEINFSHNIITQVHLDVGQLKRLEVIRLESNDISYAKFGILADNKYLKEIVLANNSITIATELVSYHGSTINYDLSNNKLQTFEIPLTMFYITNAGTLDLSNNCFQSYGAALPNEKYVDNFNYINNFVCRNCCLDKIPYGVFTVVTNKVDISFNNIEILDETNLKSFQNVSQVILSHNKIAYVNITIFKITYRHSAKLVNFDLSHNPFVCDCRLNKLIKYLRNQNAKFIFNTQNNFCSYPPALNGTSLNTIDYDLFCEYPKDCPTNCQCSVNDLDNIPYVSIVCSNSNLTYFPKIHSYSSSVAVHLNLSQNEISSLPQKHDPVWRKLTILDLSYNQLQSLKNMTISPSLSKLYLNNNSLTKFDATIASLSHLSEIRLANNPWKCDCKSSKLMIASRLFDKKYEWLCVKENRKYNFTDIDQICKKFNLFWLLLPVVTLVILLSVIVILFNKYKSEILYYMFAKGICLKFVSEEDIDADKTYDAFVSYSSEDEDWIVDFLVPGLETGVPSYKLCLHNRDWCAGEFITDQIVRSIESSRRTILVLTDSYLNSQWSRLEFDIAYQQGLKDKVRRVIVVVPNEVPDLSKIDQEFKTFITLTTYVEAKKPYFWTKLRASMPRTQNTRVPATRRQTIYLNATFTESSELAQTEPNNF